MNLFLQYYMLFNLRKKVKIMISVSEASFHVTECFCTFHVSVHLTRSALRPNLGIVFMLMFECFKICEMCVTWMQSTFPFYMYGTLGPKNLLLNSFRIKWDIPCRAVVQDTLTVFWNWGGGCCVSPTRENFKSCLALQSVVYILRYKKNRNTNCLYR